MPLISPFTPTLNYGQLVNRASPLNRGLLDWWLTLPQGGKGNKWFDIAGTGHGALTNGPVWASAMGRPGGYGSIRYDGTDDNTQCSMLSGKLTGSNAFSIAIWFRPSIDNRLHTIWDTNGESPVFFIDMRTGFNNKHRFQASGFGGPAEVQVNTSLGIEWRHVVCTWDGTNARMLINGVLQGTQSSAYTFVRDTTTIEVAATHFDRLAGEADDLRIYDRALTESEVNAIYRDSLAGYPTTLNRVRLPAFGTAAAAAGTILPRMMQEGLFCDYGGRAA